MNLYNWFCVFTTLCSSRLSNSINAKDNPIVFPGESKSLPMEMPLNLALKLSNLSDMGEFFENFIDERSRPFTGELLSARFGGGPIERKGLKTAKMASCTPEQTTVTLKPSTADVATFYYPPCTRVARCGGCCSHDLLSCQPVESEILQLGVVITEYRGGSQLTYKGRDVVAIEQHKTCKCDCKIKAADCSPYQKYSKESCRCLCTNHDKQEKCNDESATKMWNANECACVCRDILDCSSGFYFDRYTCQCVPERPRRLNTTEFNIDTLHYNVN